MKQTAFVFLPSGSQPPTAFNKQVFAKGQPQGANRRWLFHGEESKKEN